MRIFGIILLIAAALNAYGAEYASVQACVESGKKIFRESRLEKAQETFLDCYETDPKNTDVIISLAGIYLAQENLSAAKNFFEKALSLLPSTSAYNAYCYSRLGDIYFKEGNLKAAKLNYERSLKFNHSNVNSIIGRGVISEYEGDLKTAFRAYRAALSVEPYNTIARENYRRLEPMVFSDEEIFKALKARQAVDQKQETLTPRDKELFIKIHRAEQSMGVEYLNDKYKSRPPKGMVIEVNSGTPDLRFMLSRRGYEEVMRLMSMDAVKYFMDAGVRTNDVYKLRGLNRLPVFDDKNILTEEGINVYSQALEGRKSFLLPNEPAARKS